MKKIIFSIVGTLFLFSSLCMQAAPTLPKKGNLDLTIKGAITDLIEDNAAFAEWTSEEYFEDFQDIQNPRVTMVMCSDSRVQVDNFSQGAENDIFVARNIGNQFITTKGSVEYGVNVLKTPVLIFVGHSHCGAIHAARGDLKTVAPAIRKELETMDVKSAPDEKQAVALNVHNQVAQALIDFKDKIDSKEIAIIGAIYDFRNDYGHESGQLIIINLNGEKNPQRILNSHYFDDLEKVVVGI